MFKLSNPILQKATMLMLGMTAPTYVLAGPNMFNGYYGGIMGGVLRTDSQYSTDSSAEYIGHQFSEFLIASNQNDVKIHRYSGVGAIYLGYGQFISNSDFYLAGEVFGSWGHRSTSLTDVANTASFINYYDGNLQIISSQSLTTNTAIKLNKSEFAIDLRPGFLMDTNTLLYGRIGLAFNKVSSSNSVNFGYNSIVGEPGSTHSIITESKSHNKTALRLGVGLERHVTDNLSITADYIYTYYGRVKTAGIGDSIFLNGEDNIEIRNLIEDGLEGTSSAKISTQAAMIGIKYYFFPC